MIDQEYSELKNLIEGHVGRLREQGFDNVQILCSQFNDNNGTRSWEVGAGNYLARFGHAQLWVDGERKHIRRQENPDA